MRLFIIALAVMYAIFVGLAQSMNLGAFNTPMSSTMSAHSAASIPSINNSALVQVEATACPQADNAGLQREENLAATGCKD